MTHRWSMLAALYALGALAIGALVALAAADEITNKWFLKNAPVVRVGLEATPKRIQKCVLYEANPTVEMKGGAPVGVDDLFVPTFDAGADDTSFTALTRTDTIPRDVLRAMFRDPEGLCARYVLISLKVNDRLVYEVRAVEAP